MPRVSGIVGPFRRAWSWLAFILRGSRFALFLEAILSGK
jgi:hypothetical protein